MRALLICINGLLDICHKYDKVNAEAIHLHKYTTLTDSIKPLEDKDILRGTLLQRHVEFFQFHFHLALTVFVNNDRYRKNQFVCSYPWCRFRCRGYHFNLLLLSWRLLHFLLFPVSLSCPLRRTGRGSRRLHSRLQNNTERLDWRIVYTISASKYYNTRTAPQLNHTSHFLQQLPTRKTS